ncbi:CoA pyrophosphatase [Aeromicrobium phragmitis]|uniref:CoA pyrophosphatase n=1 Tax=Aeromicrobium phragmitis TaxID=2478914 RepID=A0A3L8PKN9_9ACTN|nr:CoA pyrophosphatase [Aeromicrobium phragmitis]RLV55349.1 CoA pyrophosphatase [Aeromicrobium phragmitis]
MGLAPGSRAAAVAIVLFDAGDTARYCLIKRAKRGRNAGQWALPGGKVEPGESSLDAALREAHEEVALDTSRSTVLGRLDDFVTSSGFVISPYVVAAPRGWRPIAADEEVQGAFEFAIADLLRPDVVRWARVDDGPALLQMHVAAGVRIHAPTGAVLWQFRQTALHGDEVSIAELRQPLFTHR